MSKLRTAVPVLLLVLLVTGCGALGDSGEPSAPPDGETGEDAPEPSGEEAEVRRVVEEFGRRLQHVSLLAPADEVKESMEQHYGDYVTADLLAAWVANPVNAPGRAVSSPWPDRIEIDTVERSSEDSYIVEGKIIEVTSTEAGTDQAAAVRPITLSVSRYDDRWLIDDVTLGEYESTGGDDEAGGVSYINRAYGFRLALPDGWDGFAVVHEEWEGRALADARDGRYRSGDVIERGPVLRIRHPLWTEDHPRQDIPIMVFTLSQWEALQQATFSVGAAPVGPSELARNDNYVFALPARYNFEFPEGYEEVEAILAQNPLQPLPAGAGEGAMGAAAVMAAATRPAPPSAALLESGSGRLVDWMVNVERWMHTAVLVPNALAEAGQVADEGARETVKEAIANYYTAEFAEELLQMYWVPVEGTSNYELLPTEGPAVLPFMQTVELVQANRSQIVFHATSPSPSLWEDLTRTYHLQWLGNDSAFRIARVDTEGW